MRQEDKETSNLKHIRYDYFHWVLSPFEFFSYSAFKTKTNYLFSLWYSTFCLCKSFWCCSYSLKKNLLINLKAYALNIQLGYPERCHNQLNCFQVHCSLLYFIIVYYTLKHLRFIPTTGYGFTLYYTIIYNHTWWWWWCGCGINPSLNCLTMNSTGLVWVLTVLHCNLCILNTNSLNQAIPCQI